MPEIAYDEIPLTDERKVRAIIKRLRLPQLTPEWLKGVGFGRPIEMLAYWERHLINRRTAFTWHNKTDVWLTANEDAGVLRRVVISGFSAEKDAEVLRSEVWRAHAASGQSLSAGQIQLLAEEVAAQRPERDYRETFQGCLRYIRSNFNWDGGEVVEGTGDFLPISKMGLRPEDVELLRQVYAALPRTTFTPTGGAPFPLNVMDEPCPLCGGPKMEATKATPLKDRKAARNSVANTDFMSWVNARLTDADKPGIWTLTGALHADYAGWIKTRRVEQTNGDHAETKAAVMSLTAWGTIMGKMFEKRRDGKKGYWYNVRLKKR